MRLVLLLIIAAVLGVFYFGSSKPSAKRHSENVAAANVEPKSSPTQEITNAKNGAPKVQEDTASMPPVLPDDHVSSLSHEQQIQYVDQLLFDGPFWDDDLALAKKSMEELYWKQGFRVWHSAKDERMIAKLHRPTLDESGDVQVLGTDYGARNFPFKAFTQKDQLLIKYFAYGEEAKKHSEVFEGPISIGMMLPESELFMAIRYRFHEPTQQFRPISGTIALDSLSGRFTGEKVETVIYRTRETALNKTLEGRTTAIPVWTEHLDVLIREHILAEHPRSIFAEAIKKRRADKN